VATEAELNAELARSLAADPSIPVRDAHVTVDASGLHFTASVSTPIGNFTASGDATMGPVNGKLGFKVRNLAAGPLPAAVLQSVQDTIEQNAGTVSDSFPFTVRQVALRGGCFAIMGATR
jgi:hypothetical protein